MFHIVLHQPEIPPNTGNIMRLAANTGCALHLVKPLGFQLSERALTRAGMDYRDMAQVHVHEDWAACLQHLEQTRSNTHEARSNAHQAPIAPWSGRIYALTTRGTVRHDHIAYQAGDALLFGNETSGLPAHIHAQITDDCKIRLPMTPDSRSLNLSNACAVVVYEAWRQQGFAHSTAAT